MAFTAPQPRRHRAKNTQAREEVVTVAGINHVLTSRLSGGAAKDRDVTQPHQHDNPRFANLSPGSILQREIIHPNYALPLQAITQRRANVPAVSESGRALCCRAKEREEERREE